MATMKTVSIVVKDKQLGKEYPTTFQFPTDGQAYAVWVSEALEQFKAGKPELLERLYNRTLSAYDLAARAGVRPKPASTSTVVRMDGTDYDLLTVPLAAACKAINFASGLHASKQGLKPADKREPFSGPYANAAKALAESGKAVLKANEDGSITLAPKK